MRAIVVNQPDGSADNLTVADVDEPDLGPDDAMVAVDYAGLNYADIMMQKGHYPHPKGYPLVAGIEMAGRVIAVGSGVDDIAVGDRVAAFCENTGAFAERCCVPAHQLVRIPDSIGLDQAAAFFVQGLTAWHLLHTVSETAPGDVVLIHAIGGGVGLYLTQLAKQAGATVIGTVGTPGKEKRALAFGADHVVLRDEADFVSVALDVTDGRGVDKVIDSTGASILDRSFDAMRPLGHVVSYGEAEGKPYATLWERLVRRSLTFTRLHIGHVDPRSQDWKKGAEEVMRRIGAGSITVPIEGVFPLSAVRDMYDKLQTRQVAGKLLLQVGEGGA